MNSKAVGDSECICGRKKQMLKKVLRKLKDKSGETLAETLVSVLIVSLASVVLAAMIGAASRMNVRAKAYDKELDEAILAMSAAGSLPTEKVYITLDNDTTNKLEYTVDMKTAAGNLKLSSYNYHASAEDSAPAD